ncbi:MAG: hypothetical protein ACQEWG_06225 [Bacteroidota bacterium]
MENILTWKQEVKDYNKSLKDLLDSNSSNKDLFYGFQVMDGQLKKNPLILFIGINPGIGNGKYQRDIFETEQISYLDVFNQDYREDYPNTYHLAEKTIKFFREMDWKEEKIKEVFQNQVVKTNFYHLATKDVRALNTVLKDVDISRDYFKKCADFSVGIINILKPTLVILEGKTVFQNIIKECYQLNRWNNEKGSGYHYDKNLNVHIIGYKRRGNLSINQRALFTAEIKAILEDEKFC